MGDCVCCNYLRTIKCDDTTEHRHFICKGDNALIDNETVIKYCAGDFKNCVQRWEMRKLKRD
jgi:hypothetical protein